MTRPLLALFVALGFIGCTSASSKELSVDRPNILFIYTDDHSHRTISCYPEAYPWAKTPTFDRLGREGIRFTHAYIGTWCMPSRATLLTGHHPYNVESMRMVGKYPGSEYDPEKCPFWPKAFRRNGYVTAQIGKWHTGTDTGRGRDWDHQIVWNRPKYPDTSQHYYYDQPITYPDGETRVLKEYSTDKYTEWALDFIHGKTRPKGKPWYLWLCYGAVHSPFTPARRHLQDYPGVEVPTPKDIYPPRPGKPDWMQKVEFWEKGPQGLPVLKRGRNRKPLHEWVRQYHQAVKALDEGVAKLLAALEETGQRKNTLIVWTADQGFAWGQHGFRTKLAAYDATIRCPLIVSMPGTLPQGKVCPTPVGGTDLVPTFFRFAGIDLPWRMDGHDITPLLLDPSAPWPHPVLTTLTGASYGSDTDRIPTEGPELYRSGVVPWWVSLIRGRTKYIRTLVAGEPEELYDLEKDPRELTNLALDPKYASTLARFREDTVAELRRTKAGMADALPPVGGAR